MKKVSKILVLVLALALIMGIPGISFADTYGGGAAVNFFVGNDFANEAGVDMSKVTVTISDAAGNTWTGIPSPFGSKHQQYVIDVPPGDYTFSIDVPGYTAVIDDSDLPATTDSITVTNFKNSVYVLLTPETPPVITTKDETKTETVPYTTEYRDNPNLLVGEQKVVQTGKNGVRTIVETVTYTDGVETGRVEKSNTITTPAVNEIIERGTGVAVVSEEVVKEDIPFNTIKEYDPTLAAGEEKEKQAGVLGEKEVTYKVTTFNGVVTKDKVSEKVVKEAVDRILLVGTKEISANPSVQQPYTGDTKVSGSGVPGATITVTLPDGTTQVTVVVGTDGKWTVDVPELKKGDIITAIQVEKGKAPSGEVKRIVTDKTTDGVGGGGDDDNIVDRIDGEDRFETAVEVSKENYDKAKIAVVVNGHLFPDALTATVLADVLDAPLLLVNKDDIPEATKAELVRLGVEEIILVGGPNTISIKVEDLLKEDYSVERIGGTDRYETAKLVAARVVSITGQDDLVLLARGDIFPDALTISSLAIREGAPILLTMPTVLPEYTKASLAAINPDDIVIAGQTASVSKEIEDELKKDADVLRIGGADRYETATMIAAYTYPNAKRALVASGEVYIDALAAGPLTDEFGAPILLVQKDNVPKIVLEYLKGEGKEINHFTIVGGVNTISTKVEGQLK